MSLTVTSPLGSTATTPNPSSAETRARRASLAARASVRRRQIDPTTCERDYSVAELEFMTAMQAYKASSGRQFPTWSEVLEVVRDLGYAKPAGSLDEELRRRCRGEKADGGESDLIASE